MERLTERVGEFIRIKGCSTLYSDKKRKGAYLYNAIVRLAEYEDVGLEPKEIIGLCDMDKRAKMADMLRLEEYQALGPIAHLRELVEAETPAPVIMRTETDREYIDYICPKCRDIIDQIRKGQKQGAYRPKYHDDCGQRLDWSHAEAEAAQGGGENG
nr:MAG TPA: hypothetical protein [Caudoviricetes sp.]